LRTGKRLITISEAFARGGMSIQKGSTFDCPACDVTAPSASVPYDALGYAICPVCSHTTAPASDDA